MALPTLDAVFASAADQPRRYMLAKWLVEEKNETAASNVLISGVDEYAGSDINEIFLNVGLSGGKPLYEKNINGDIVQIIWDTGTSAWILNFSGDGLFTSNEDVAYPWLVTSWNPENGTGNPVLTEVINNPISNYYDLPERYLWAKIAVAAGAPRGEADYISLPKQYVWKAIYDSVSGSSLGTIDWSEKQALGHIAAAYRGDTANPANLATYIDWPWRYQVASIITALSTTTTYNAVIVSEAGFLSADGTYTFIEDYNGKPYYSLYDFGPTTASISWDIENNRWVIWGDGGEEVYNSNNDTQFPWEATFVVGFDGSPPVPTLTPTNV
jgi:hypothetical protein